MPGGVRHEGLSLHTSQMALQVRAYLTFCSSRQRQEYLYLPLLDGMLIHRRVNLSCYLVEYVWLCLSGRHHLKGKGHDLRIY